MSETPHILITRPAHQGARLRALLERGGARVSHCPTIEIVDLSDAATNIDKARRIDRYDMLIFISRNAVDYGSKSLQQAGIAFDATPPVAAIGRSTARELTARGFNVVACPERPASEDLLATDGVRALPSNAATLIFRGRGGKEVLATQLRARGHFVEYAEVYERVCPPQSDFDIGLLDAAAPDLILVASRDSLDNLYAMVADERARARLLETTIVLGSASMLERHAELGFTAEAVMADTPLDEDMARAALEYLS